MYVARVDAEILSSEEMNKVKSAYIELFGKDKLPQFNYADFQRQGPKCSAQIYKETLKKCIVEGKPYNVVSKWIDVYEEYFKAINKSSGEDKE